VNYRLAKIEDVPQIDELCKRDNLATPCDGTTYVAEYEGKIIGFVNFAPVTLINCFVSDSSLAFNILYEKMASVLETLGANRIVMFTKKKDVEELAMKKGFVFTNTNVNTMEKNHGIK
jgi:hypothetical protein